MKVPFKSSGGFCVYETGFTEDFPADLCEFGVVSFEFGPRVDMVVVMVILAIVIKPRLNTFRKILVMVDTGILALP